MRTIKITKTFDGYPNGKTKQTFLAGEEIEVSDAYAKLILDKGYGTEKASAGPQASHPTEPAKDSAGKASKKASDEAE